MKRHLISDDLTNEKNRLLDRAQGYSELGMYKEALEESKRLMRIDPNDPPVFIELGVSYEEIGRAEKAIKCYKYAIKNFPGDAGYLTRLYVNLGYCLEKYKKQHNTAMVCYEKALDLDPRNEWALNNIGSILKREGKREESLLFYKRACRVCKQKYGSVCNKMLHNLAWAFYLCKDYETAQSIYEYLAGDCPERNYVLSDYGCVCYRMGNYEKAWDLFEKARSMYPKVRYYRRLCKVVRKRIE
jgi:tetratricopeptide (TPR) repeat protein